MPDAPPDRPAVQAPHLAAADSPRTDEMVVRLEGVSKDYRLGNETVPALRNVSVNIEYGVFLAIAGPSGSGKSTLLNLIGCIDRPTSGRIVVAGVEVSGKGPDELAPLRARSIGFIFQTFNLFPVLSAEENVEYPLLNMPEIGARERRRRVRKFLDLVKLRKYAKHRPSQLSGGQRQRVAIARALAIHPKLVLADEPTANLDHRTGGRILRLMRKINRSMNTTFIFSTHDQRVLDMADRRIDLEDGEIVRLGVRNGDRWQYALERRRSALIGEGEGDTVPSDRLAAPDPANGGSDRDAALGG